MPLYPYHLRYVNQRFDCLTLCVVVSETAPIWQPMVRAKPVIEEQSARFARALVMLDAPFGYRGPYSRYGGGGRDTRLQQTQLRGHGGTRTWHLADLDTQGLSGVVTENVDHFHH